VRELCEDGKEEWKFIRERAAGTGAGQAGVAISYELPQDDASTTT
jgi:hypothetical protein